MHQRSEDNKVLLEVKELRKYFPILKGFFRRYAGDVKAVDGVSFSIRRGETLGLVGESGCGKTTLGRVIAAAYRPTEGQILFRKHAGPAIDVAALRRSEVQQYLRKVQMVFQDPYSSLNSRRTVMQIIEEPLICLTNAGSDERKQRVRQLLKIVGLDVRYAERYPHAFSGGQRQRIGVARALAANPTLMVCDEAVSALDVSVQAQIINLLTDLQKEFELTYLFISHDLSVVKHISNRIAVMYVGKFVEVAPSVKLFADPKHPYTEALLSAVLRPDPTRPSDAIILEGDVANPANKPKGCCFHPRCRYAKEICHTEDPPLQEVGGEEHLAACHFAKELVLRGMVGTTQAKESAS